MLYGLWNAKEYATPWETVQLNCECRKTQALNFPWAYECNCEDSIKLHGWLKDIEWQVPTKNIKQITH